MKRLPIFCFLLCLVCLTAGLPDTIRAAQSHSAQSAKDAPQKDKIRATKTLRGVFLGFEAGDYLHAVIKTSVGKTVSLFLNGQDIAYFLALHKGKAMTVTYEIVDTYIEEAGGVTTIERLTAARVKKQTFAAWWKRTGSKYTAEQREKKYGKRVEEAMISQ